MERARIGITILRFIYISFVGPCLAYFASGVEVELGYSWFFLGRGGWVGGGGLQRFSLAVYQLSWGILTITKQTENAKKKVKARN